MLDDFGLMIRIWFLPDMADLVPFQFKEDF